MSVISARLRRDAEPKVESMSLRSIRCYGYVNRPYDSMTQAVKQDPEEPEPRSALSRVTRLALHWQAATRPGLFPTMEATLSFDPLSPDETQLDFEGTYEPKRA